MVPKSGPDALSSFLTNWYGPSDTEPTACTDPRLPQPLREWFSTVSGWSVLSGDGQNVVLDADGIFDDDDKTVFWVENQGVWLWGIDPTDDSDDPAVFDREAAGIGWQPVGVCLTTFLTHIAVFETIWRTQHGASSAVISPDNLATVLAPMRPIPGATWRWPQPGTQLYAGPDLLAMAGSLDHSAELDSEVFIAGRTADALRYLEPLDVDWESQTWRST